MLFRVSVLAQTVPKLPDGTAKKVEKTESICPIYREEFEARDMSFEFSKVDWLQYLGKETDYIGVLSVVEQNVLLKERSRTAASVVHEGQARPATSEVGYGAEKDEGWDVEGSVGLEEVERAGVKLGLRDF